MLFDRRALEGIADGSIDLAFRRWERARVRPGSRQRTAVGVIAIDAVEATDHSAITGEEAVRAGLSSRSELLTRLDRRGGGVIYRIELHWVGEDPRLALRAQTDLSDTELTDLRARLDRLDRASRHGPWTRQILELVHDHPAIRAADLAARIGREKQPFKRDVRRLKELGLTESLDTGYRLSPRGRAFLERIG